MNPRPISYRAETSPSPRSGSNMGNKGINNFGFDKFERAVVGVHGKVPSPSNPFTVKKDNKIPAQPLENNDYQVYGTISSNDPLRTSLSREKCNIILKGFEYNDI